MAVKFRNKLVYPSGRRSGVDPTHPASRELVLSAVAGPGNNFINLSTGAPLTPQDAQSGVPSAGIHGIIGPTVTSVGSGKALGVAAVRTYNQLTAGAIFRYSASTDAAYQTIIAVDHNAGLYTRTDKADFYNGLDIFGITLDFNTPYFFAASTIKAGAGSPYSLVVKNLTTGVVSIAQGTSAAAAFAGTTVSVGNDTTTTEASTFPIAAAALSDTFLSLSQLLQWAEDPWAFWYPRFWFNGYSTLFSTQSYAAFSTPQAAGQVLVSMIGI